MITVVCNSMDLTPETVECSLHREVSTDEVCNLSLDVCIVVNRRMMVNKHNG